MRGQAAAGRKRQYIPGITPADAGTSGGLLNRPETIPDHPRGCGDKGFEPMDPQVGGGSPPRMRGQGTQSFLLRRIRGITPADAGTSFCRYRKTTSAWDHPRGCGDKVDSGLDLFYQIGSPPRMRGQVVNGIVVKCYPGITPADAGTRYSFASQNLGMQDHPRGCGDKQKKCSAWKLELGSPPRMRGQV